MAERSLFWTDGVGDGGPYSQDQFRLWAKTLAPSDGANIGVIPTILNLLKPTSSGNNNVTVDTGRALVDGTLYENDASKAITVASPTVGTTGKRLVLQKSWAARTVRAVVISSADGVATIPALTQSDGTTWEIPIASFTITTAGVIGSLTDQREFTREATINIVIGEGGVTMVTGVKGDFEIPFKLLVLAWTLLADQSGSIVLDLWKDTYANYPPTVADTVTGTEKPTLSSALKNQDTLLTTWSPIWSKGDIVRVNVDSVSTVQRVTLSLRVALI